MYEIPHETRFFTGRGKYQANGSNVRRVKGDLTQRVSSFGGIATWMNEKGISRMMVEPYPT